jgi:broad specificity phosphatase PhoE
MDGAAAMTRATPRRIFLVRHAEAGERSTWQGDDRLRPLTARGRRQAQALAEALDGQQVRHLLSSGYIRCLETLEPLAERIGRRPEPVAWLEEGADADSALASLVAAGDVVASTHGDVVSGVLFALAAASVDLGPSPRMQKGSTWVLDVERGQVTGARYVPPPPS